MMPEPTNNQTHMFITQCEQSQNLFRIKNAEYGNTIVKTGVLGAVVELIGACARLPQMVLKNETHGRTVRDKLIDVLRDIHNYASIALSMLDQDNWEGE